MLADDVTCRPKCSGDNSAAAWIAHVVSQLEGNSNKATWLGKQVKVNNALLI